MTTSPATELLEKTDTYTVATWRRLLMLVWRGSGNATGIERSSVLFDRWVERLGAEACFLIVMPPGKTTPPDDATRAAMERAASSRSPRCKGTATLVEAEGFVAATVRSVMMRLQPIAGEATTFVRTVGEAADWAGTLLGDAGVTPAGLEAAIRQAREG